MNGMYYQERSVATSIILSIITCGIYGIYWYICLNDEVLRTTGRQGMSGVMVFLCTLITCGIYSIYWSYKMGEFLDEEKRMRGVYTSNYSGILYLVLDLIGLGIVAWALIQNELNMLNRGQKLEYEFNR